MKGDIITKFQRAGGGERMPLNVADGPQVSAPHFVAGAPSISLKADTVPCMRIRMGLGRASRVPLAQTPPAKIQLI